MQRFLKHLRDPSPAFACRRKVPSDNNDGRIVRVRHELGPPASQRDLAKLTKFFGDQGDSLAPLYAAHNGMLLYTDGNRAALDVFAIGELKKRNRERRQWFRDWEQEDLDDLWDFAKHGQAFAQVPMTENYLVLWEGRIYFYENDGGEEQVAAGSADEFFESLAADPTAYATRYAPTLAYPPPPGWAPEEYVSSVD